MKTPKWMTIVESGPKPPRRGRPVLHKEFYEAVKLAAKQLRPGQSIVCDTPYYSNGRPYPMGARAVLKRWSEEEGLPLAWYTRDDKLIGMRTVE